VTIPIEIIIILLNNNNNNSDDEKNKIIKKRFCEFTLIVFNIDRYLYSIYSVS